MNTDILQKAREKAARAIAKAEREVAILETLPDTGKAPMIVQQRDCVWLVYRGASFGDVLATFDAFDLAPFCVTKKAGWAATVSREEVDGAETLLSDGFAWCAFTQYAEMAPAFSFRAHGALSDGTPCQVHVDFEGAHYSKGPFHWDLAARFTCENPHFNRREENLRYRAQAPAFMALAAFTWYSGTGRDNGSAMYGNGAFMSRDCLARALETLSA